jgi:phosphatidylserine/phosphatidylglycerophosphate/cardiolipin synthase-like enzyme
VVNLLAGHVLKAFAEHAQAHRDPRAARVRFFEYKKPAGPVLSLHSKVSVFGDDLMVGSANTDVRSYMMDSNNALFVRGAPKLRDAYLRHFSEVMADGARSRDLTDYFASVSRDAIKAEDQARFRELLAKYGAERYLTPQQRAAAEVLFLALLDKVYALTKASLAGGPDAEEKAEEFNRLFKPI